MNRQENLEILKKINILKGHLIASESEVIVILKIIDELFAVERPTKIESIKLELNNGNKLESLNLLNNFKENIAKLLFKNPCSKQWYNLVNTDSYDTKYCTDCRKNVYLVSTEEELIKRRNLEQCVAINSFDINVNDDNDKNYKACHIKFTEEYELGLPM